MLWSSAFTVLWLAGYAVAQDQTGAASPTASRADTHNFDIPAQRLAGALSAFNRQSGFQVTQASGDTQPGVTVNAVRGTMSPQQALAQMLAGTGIPFWFTGNRAAVIGGQHSASTDAADESFTVLAPIIIRSSRRANTGSGFQGTPDWVYETPSSVSVVSREAIKKAPSRNARDLLDNVAGVLVNRSEGQNPGMSINIRGLQDQNRVVTMIDGARQNFQRNGHGASQRTYVDTAFFAKSISRKAAFPASVARGRWAGR
ncbi:STN domain-containing protein [Neorhizobium sp. T25_27]|uniref:STN domain-containing protein n=1 Tax=Neorhizobium sp. T25_27 TaxID=2093831 RepID=UPI001FDF51ED|nr:STN domain-containing protein [Neorhizobium sp. T25_27]